MKAEERVRIHTIWACRAGEFARTIGEMLVDARRGESGWLRNWVRIGPGICGASSLIKSNRLALLRQARRYVISTESASR